MTPHIRLQPTHSTYDTQLITTSHPFSFNLVTSLLSIWSLVTWLFSHSLDFSILLHLQPNLLTYTTHSTPSHRSISTWLNFLYPADTSWHTNPMTHPFNLSCTPRVISCERPDYCTRPHSLHLIPHQSCAPSFHFTPSSTSTLHFFLLTTGRPPTDAGPTGPSIYNYLSRVFLKRLVALCVGILEMLPS